MSSPTLSPDLPEYLLQLALVQLLTKAAPFTHTRTLPLHALSHVVSSYIQLLASTASQAAELAGRTQVGVWDVGRAIEEFGTGGLGELRSEVQQGKMREEEEGMGERVNVLAESLRGE